MPWTSRLLRPLAMLALLALCLTQGSTLAAEGVLQGSSAHRAQAAPTDGDPVRAILVAADEGPAGSIAEEREASESEEDEEPHLLLATGQAARVATDLLPREGDGALRGDARVRRRVRCCDAPRGPPVGRA